MSGAFIEGQIIRRLSKSVDIPPEFWLQAQMNYGLAKGCEEQVESS